MHHQGSCFILQRIATGIIITAHYYTDNYTGNGLRLFPIINRIRRAEPIYSQQVDIHF